MRFAHRYACRAADRLSTCYNFTCSSNSADGLAGVNTQGLCIPSLNSDAFFQFFLPADWCLRVIRLAGTRKGYASHH